MRTETTRPFWRRWRWRLLGGFVLIAGAIAAVQLLGFGPGRDDSGPRPEYGRSIEIVRGDLVISVGAVGNVKASRSDGLQFESQGILAEILVAPGDRVAEGQLLARLDAADRLESLEEAEQSLEVAGLEHLALLEPADPDDLLLARLALLEAENALARLQDFGDPERDIALRQQLLTSQRGLLLAQQNLAEQEGGPTAGQITAATAAFQRAESNWLQERQSYQDFLDGPSELVLETARLTLKQAEETLAEFEDSSRTTQTDIDLQALVVIEARERLAELEEPISESARRQRAASLAAAQQDYETARLNLIEVTEGDSDETSVLQFDYQAALLAISAAQLALEEYQAGPEDHEITDAENAIVRRQVELRRLQSPPDAGAVRKSELTIVSARRRVEAAREEISNTELRAPYAGVITSVAGTLGASPPSDFVTLQSSARPQIATQVSEIDIGKIEIGQKVEIEPDIFGARETFAGSIAAINPEATSDFGLVTYELTVEFDSDPTNLLPGMTVALKILIESHPDVLMIPLAALIEEGDRSYVLVAGDLPDEVFEQDVVTGARNDSEVEIVSGLSEGQMLRTQLAGFEEVDLFGGGPPDGDQGGGQGGS